MKKWIIAVLLVAGLALAGQVVDQGSPGKSGAWPVTCTNCSASTGDGGATTVTNTPGSPLYVIVLDGGSSSSGGTVTQGAGQDGGAWNVAFPAVVQGAGQDGGAWAVTQSTNDRLRARGASEADAGTNVNTWAAGVIGASDTSNLVRVPRVYDLDNDTGTDWVLGASLRTGIFGGSQPIASVQSSEGLVTLAVYDSRKLNHTSPTNTSVDCAAGAATAAPASLLTNRVTLTMVNNSEFTIYLGGSGVTTANGLPLAPGASFSDDVEETPYYCRSGASDGGTANLRVMEN